MTNWAGEVRTWKDRLASLACKEGDLDAAREWLDKAFALDEGLRENAETDEDLEALRARSNE